MFERNCQQKKSWFNGLFHRTVVEWRTENRSSELAIRFGIVLVFGLLYLSAGSSGAFLFDNNSIADATLDWDGDWGTRLESAYEWGLLFVLIAGLYQFSGLVVKGVLPQVSISLLMKLGAVSGIVAFLYVTELRDFKAQQAVVEEFERQGGCILLKYNSMIMDGIWYRRFPLGIGIVCSIFGGLSFVFRFAGLDLPDQPKS